MANKKPNTRANSTREKLSARVRRAYQRGYRQGFDDSAKNSNGSKFWGTRGYNKGYGDKQKVRKIERRYNNYKNA